MSSPQEILRTSVAARPWTWRCTGWQRKEHTTPRVMATAGRISGLVIQALRHLGQRQVVDTVVANLQKRLSGSDKKVLLRDLRYAPAWIAAILRRISGSEGK